MSIKKPKRIVPAKRHAAFVELENAQGRIVREATRQLQTLRSSGNLTVGKVAGILVKRDEAFAKCEEDFQIAVGSRRPAPVLKQKVKPKPVLKTKTKVKTAKPKTAKTKVKAKRKHILKSKEEAADAKRQSSRQSYQSLRAQVIQHYGGPKPECVFCKSKRLPFYLQHTQSTGSHNRRTTAGYTFSTSYSAATYYRWLIAHNYPKQHEQVILCKQCFKMLTNKPDWRIRLKEQVDAFAPFALFSPRVLSNKAAAEWNRILQTYLAACVSFWRSYLHHKASKTDVTNT